MKALVDFLFVLSVGLVIAIFIGLLVFHKDLQAWRVRERQKKEADFVEAYAQEDRVRKQVDKLSNDLRNRGR